MKGFAATGNLPLSFAGARKRESYDNHRMDTDSAIFTVVFAVTKPIGIYMFSYLPRAIASPCHASSADREVDLSARGVDPKEQQEWKQYSLAMLLFSATTMLVTYAIERCSMFLPLNPAKMVLSRPISPSYSVEFRHQHELAGLRWRIDDELLDSDGGACLAQFYLGRRWHRRYDGSRAGVDVYAAIRALLSPSVTFGWI